MDQTAPAHPAGALPDRLLARRPGTGVSAAVAPVLRASPAPVRLRSGWASCPAAPLGSPAGVAGHRPPLPRHRLRNRALVVGGPFLGPGRSPQIRLAPGVPFPRQPRVHRHHQPAGDHLPVLAAMDTTRRGDAAVHRRAFPAAYPDRSPAHLRHPALPWVALAPLGSTHLLAHHCPFVRVSNVPGARHLRNARRAAYGHGHPGHIAPEVRINGPARPRAWPSPPAYQCYSKGEKLCP